MIELLMAAVTECSGPLRNGDWYQTRYINPLLAEDEPMYQMIRAHMIADLYKRAGEIPGLRVQTYYFSPRYLQGVWDRVSYANTIFFQEGPRSLPDYGGLVAVGRAPRSREKGV